MTRATLLRLLIGLRMLHAGNFSAFYWLLPIKWKQSKDYLFHAFLRPAMIEIRKNIMKDYEFLRGSNWPDVGTKIGGTLNVRMPLRFNRL